MHLEHVHDQFPLCWSNTGRKKLEIILYIVNKQRLLYYITLVYRDGSFTITVSLCKVNMINFKVILKFVYSFEDYL